MRPLTLLLFPFILLSSCYNPLPVEVIDDLKIISGEWKSYKGVEFRENWIIVDQNVLEGVGFSMNEADTAFFEALKIERVGDSVYYKVLLEKKGDDISFLLTEASKSSWTFVNPENDYPSIIDYHIENDTLLTVTISNIRGNKKQFFYLEKVR